MECYLLFVCFKARLLLRKWSEDCKNNNLFNKYLIVMAYSSQIKLIYDIKP